MKLKVVQWTFALLLLTSGTQAQSIWNPTHLANVKQSIGCADKARKEEKNAAKRRVVPRTINKDGSLAMIHPHDWCSGFFPGSLWQVYAYTHDDYWRQQAIS